MISAFSAHVQCLLQGQTDCYLQETAKYRVEGSETVYTGKMLMNVGVDFSLRGAYKSRIIRLIRVN